MVSVVSKGCTVIGPLASSFPPPGGSQDSARVAGPATGHVKSSTRTWSFVTLSVVVGLTVWSMNTAAPGDSVMRSTRICSKPRASAPRTGKSVRPTARLLPDVAGAAPGDGFAPVDVEVGGARGVAGAAGLAIAGRPDR